MYRPVDWVLANPDPRLRMSKPSGFTYSLHLLVLFSIAVAQPLYDLLSRYPEFFVAKIGGVLDGRAEKILHTVFLTLFLTIIALQVLKRIPGIPLSLLIAGALLLASSLCLLYVRSASAKFYLTVLGPVILLFPAPFLLDGPVYRIVFGHPSPGTAQVVWGTKTPVLLVVFDEFPLVSLLDENRQIDPIRYPDFASLAGESHWFRNATSISDDTLVSLPAILTGRYPNPDEPKIPILFDHPWNLFTLLAGSHELRVFENGTQLSPTTENPQGLSTRISSLFWDLTLVYAHLTLPSELTNDLPAITHAWKNFLEPGVDPSGNGKPKTESEPVEPVRFDFSERSSKFYEFIDSIEAGVNPALYFFTPSYRTGRGPLRRVGSNIYGGEAQL